MLKPVYGRYTLGADATTTAVSIPDPKTFSEGWKSPALPPLAKVGIGIGGIALIGLAVWFFFLRKKG